MKPSPRQCSFSYRHILHQKQNDPLLDGAMDMVVIDHDGMPMNLRVPDPRIFAAHKLWLSQRPDRRPGKRDRDASQAAALAQLVLARAPVLPALPSVEALKKQLSVLGLK